MKARAPETALALTQCTAIGSPIMRHLQTLRCGLEGYDAVIAAQFVSSRTAHVAYCGAFGTCDGLLGFPPVFFRNSREEGLSAVSRLGVLDFAVGLGTAAAPTTLE